MSPRVRFLGHPAHVVLTDFPIALWVTSVLADGLTLGFGPSPWERWAFGCLALGLLMAVPTILTGLLDYLALPADHPAVRAATVHMTLMLTATGAFTTSLVLRVGVSPPTGVRWLAALVFSGAGLAALVVGGWWGGELVLRYGVGTRVFDFSGVRPQDRPIDEHASGE
ncbi:hypothetical protein HRbin11_02006 [bacterium HR11]|nr:hypothetical protein HRbin11_02006 [bacterium HR11]